MFKIIKPHKNHKTIGKRFNMLTVISHGGYSGKNPYYNVECDCGNTRRVAFTNLYNAKSCGCASGEKYPPLYEIPKEFVGIESKVMRDGKLLVFANGEILRIKGKLFYKCSKVSTSRGGRYKCITYVEDGKQVQEYVHRIMAEAFIPNPDEKEQVNHIDNNGHNNDLENLEWVTDKENKAHAREVLGNYSMKNAKMCIFCESEMTKSALQVCENCSKKVKRLKTAEEKLKRLNEKYSDVDPNTLTHREKVIVSLTIKGQTLEEIADTYKISKQRVSQILKKVLERKQPYTT